MEGTLGDAVLADAIAKGIGGFNRTAAYAAIRQDAFLVPSLPKKATRWDTVAPGFGRSALKGYLDLGYVPDGFRDSRNYTVADVVSRTLDYLLADKAIAHAAEALGFAGDAEALHLRAANYSRLFDAATGFLRARSPNGSFLSDPHWEKQGQYAWGSPYVEAGPWQYRFNVPWDPEGLAAMFREAGLDMCDELERMMTGPSHYGLYAGREVIHEQTEMKSHCWGQYGFNNQPVHHVPYMFAAAEGSLNGRCASRGQRWIRKTLLELYKPGSAMYSGDEDNGEMGAWFVLSALGLYLLEPGSPSYALGSPLFGRVVLRPQGRKELQIVAEGNSRDNPYVEAAFFGHEAGGSSLAELAGPRVQYGALAGGGLGAKGQQRAAASLALACSRHGRNPDIRHCMTLRAPVLVAKILWNMTLEAFEQRRGEHLGADGQREGGLKRLPTDFGANAGAGPKAQLLESTTKAPAASAPTQAAELRDPIAVVHLTSPIPAAASIAKAMKESGRRALAPGAMRGPPTHTAPDLRPAAPGAVRGPPTHTAADLRPAAPCAAPDLRPAAPGAVRVPPTHTAPDLRPAAPGAMRGPPTHTAPDLRPAAPGAARHPPTSTAPDLRTPVLGAVRGAAGGSAPDHGVLVPLAEDIERHGFSARRAFQILGRQRPGIGREDFMRIMGFYFPEPAYAPAARHEACAKAWALARPTGGMIGEAEFERLVGLGQAARGRAPCEPPVGAMVSTYFRLAERWSTKPVEARVAERLPGGLISVVFRSGVKQQIPAAWVDRVLQPAASAAPPAASPGPRAEVGRAPQPAAPEAPRDSGQRAPPPAATRALAPAEAGRGLVGLQNLGNSCYSRGGRGLPSSVPLCVNSLLQCLAGAEPLVGYCRADGPLQRDPGREEQFDGVDQQDAQEFADYLLTCLHEQLNREASIVTDVFQGQLRSQIQCLRCGLVSRKFETFTCLSLPVVDAAGAPLSTLEQCFGEFSREEKLSGGERWNCPRCRDRVDAAKVITLWRLPRVLISREET
ncbi:unnamed protein product [Prorocentrum cordatum]|uniref:USP domain-containing protein n=1 Tax=Prorocentrum cordatum TaxID=2364126 RepID=A0ABN9W3H5_9DINO|nr:unnamed protein product [Polarella glacialis]